MPAVPGTIVSLYVTCIIDQIYPEVGVSVVRVLRKLGVPVDFPPDQTCCGQPLFNSGFATGARQLAERVLHSFRDATYVVVPSGSCAAMMRVFYLDLFDGEPAMRQQAQELSSKVYEFSEFLVKVLKVTSTGAPSPGTATYHPSCHLLRELGVRREPEQLLAAVAGLDVVELPEKEVCCGFGGTFSIKYPHISQGMLEDKVNNVLSTRADTLISCDMSCLMNIGGALSRQQRRVKLKHLAQVLDQGAG
ncbi:MAG TPA: (Fe-S)-binding protein [Dehalococcoidia bacterium]|nr:(Fe-S)-binding protein [Dehalococcoidia bacterium]